MLESRRHGVGWHRLFHRIAHHRKMNLHGEFANEATFSICRRDGLCCSHLGLGQSQGMGGSRGAPVRRGLD